MRRFEILLIGLCLFAAAALYDFTSRFGSSTAQTEFENITEINLANMRDRLDTYLQSLNGTAAFLDASDSITADEFEDFVRSLDIPRFLPGISGIGVITPVPRGAEVDFQRAMRSLGYDGFDIHPRTISREKLVINRIAPLAPNREALGLDITFDSERREAALASREANAARLTPRILLVQDSERQPGFLLLRPWFAGHAPSVQTKPDAASFRGWVYAPFIGRAALDNLTPDQNRNFILQVYDGTEVREGALIYQSGDLQRGAGAFTAEYRKDFFGTTWTIVYQSTPAFSAGHQDSQPLWILIGSAMLIAMLVFSLVTLRKHGAAQSELAEVRALEVTAREEEIASVIDNAVTPIFVLDAARDIRFANSAAAACFGYAPYEIKGLNFLDFVPDLAAAGEETLHAIPGRTKNGQDLVLDVACNAWKTAEGDARTTVIVRDLTAEEETRQELAESRTLNEIAMQAGRIGVFEIDLQTGKSKVSNTWRELMQVQDVGRGEDPQKIFLSRVHPDDRPALYAADKACIAGETERSVVEYRLDMLDETWRWMRSDSVVIERAPDGRALRFLGMQMDISDLKSSHAALEASEARFRSVLDTAPVPMALLHSDGRFAEVNQALCTLVGCPEEDLIASAKLEDFIDEADLDKLRQGVADAMQSSGKTVYQAEHGLTDIHGRGRWGLLNITWAYDQNVGTHFFIVQINDITDKKKIEQIKNEFVSTVSHELRTPLTSIKGALGLIEAAEGEGMSPTSRRLIDIARSNTDRLTTIVNDILDLEKISSGDVPFEFEPVDLCALAEDAILEMAPFAMTHNNRLRVDVPAHDVLVRADRSRAKQVLANLISNACKYSDADTDVVVKVEGLEGKAIAFVQNLGPGIPESFKPQMFQAFSQADSSDTRAKGGTGLGLNITRQIIDRHDGNIGFESIPGRITVFWFTLPLSSDEDAQTGKTRLPIFTTTQDRKQRVLHVEGDGEFAEVVRSALVDVADVQHVTTADQAKVALSERAFDLVLMERELGNGDSEAVLAVLEKNHPDVRVIGLSAGADLHRDPRMEANLVKSRTDLSAIAAQVSGYFSEAS